MLVRLQQRFTGNASSCDTLNREKMFLIKEINKSNFTNQRNLNSLFCPGNHFHALYVKFSDRTEKRFIVQQCDSRVSKDQRRFCGRRKRLQYRLQTENESALFPPSLRENTARPTSCLTVSHTQTFIHLCNHMPVHTWPQGSGHSTKANHLLH